MKQIFVGMSTIQEGLPFLGINSHFNQTLNDPVETIVELNREILDPGKHSAIIFKE